MSDGKNLSAAEVEAFNAGLKMGQAVGSVIGCITGLVVSAAIPLLPWAVGTVVMGQKGWEYGGKAGMAVMEYKGSKDLELKHEESN
jgi:phage tail tape-measure protein